MNTKLTSVWISANAGSGKTRALVHRVVRLLLLGVAPERICCITYTKAAATEMRERIVKALRELLIVDDAACAAILAELLGREANAADIARARSLFAAVLDSPMGGVQLTTIHGFCQQLLKKFPMEAGIAPLFSVLDDAERSHLQRAARRRLFDINAENTLSNAIRLLAERSGELRVEGLLHTIEQRHGEWNQVLNHQSPEHVAALIYAEHGVSPEMTADGLYAEFVRTLLSAEEMQALRAALPEFLGHKNKTEQNLGAILAPWLEEFPTENRALTDALLKHFVTKDYLENSRSISKNAPLPELLGRIRERCVAHRLQLAALTCAEESVALMQVAFAYRGLLQQLKFERQTLDYDDLIQRVSDLLNGPMIGWVMRKLDHRIDHLLVDEAQDTSPDQWRIAKALTEELIATDEGVAEGGTPRSLLVVGDEKQSIFSFQGAAPECFAREETYFQQLLSVSNAPLQRLNLQTSYRSANAILRVVDAVAAMPAVAAGLSESGIHAPHLLHRVDAVGCVRLYPLVMAPETQKLPPFTMPKHYTETQSAAALLAEQIAGQIAGWIKEARILPSLGRAIMPGDILILVHRRRPMAPALIRALEKRGVPVSGLDRLTLSEHLAVRDLLALMAWCMHPGDNLSLAHVLRSPIMGMSDEALRAIAVNRPGSLWQALQTDDAAIAAQMQELFECRTQSPYDFLTQVLEVRGARKRFASRFGEEVHEILDELKSQAAQMPVSMVPSIAYFYDWMTKSERIIKREQESHSNAVRIMTVHGSKGLEAPVVLMPDTMKLPDLSKEGMYFVHTAHGARLPALALSEEAKYAPLFERAKQQRKIALDAEYQRLLYVALTRAREELHVYGAANREPKIGDANEVSCWYNTIQMALKSLPDWRELDDGTLEYRDAGSAQPTIGMAQQTKAESASPAWLHEPVKHRVSPRAAPLSPSRIATPHAFSSSGKANAAARGVRIHRVLQWLQADSDAAAIQRLIQLAAPDWDAAEKQSALDEIMAVHAAHRWVWGAGSQPEVSIAGMLEMGGQAQSFLGQMDRIVNTAEGLVIIDFKTGQPSARVAEHYVLQLKIYQALLQQIHLTTLIRCAVLWTENAQLHWLDEALSNVDFTTALSLQELIQNEAAVLDAF